MRQRDANVASMRQIKIKVRTYSDESRPELKFVINYREAGKRKRSFFETKNEADTFAQTRNIELKNAGREGAEFPAALRIMAQECKDALSAYGRTIKDATDFFVRYLAASEKSCSAAQLVDELVAAKKTDGASIRHVNDLRYRLNNFANKFDGQPVATITTKEIDDWLRSLKVAPITRNHYRALIILAFNFAVRRGYATDNPAKQTDRATERSGEIGILTVTQAARLLESATPGMLPYLAIGLFAGLRRAEIHRLDWREIDFESGLIEVTAAKSKTAQRRFVTMQPNLREWLMPVRKHKGNVTPGEIEFRAAFNQARAAAGITEWPDNALRHRFASYHLARFRNAADTSLQLGHHDSPITFAHYRELVKPKDAQRYWEVKPSADAAKKVVAFASQ